MKIVMTRIIIETQIENANVNLSCCFYRKSLRRIKSTKDQKNSNSGDTSATKYSNVQRHTSTLTESTKEIIYFNFYLAIIFDQMPSNINNKMAKCIKETTHDKGLHPTVNSANQSIEDKLEIYYTILDKDEIGKNEVMLTSHNHRMYNLLRRKFLKF